MAISYAHRVTAVGMTRSGKSEILRNVFASMRARRVLVDPKGEWQIRGYPMHQLAAVTADQARAEIDAIPWSAPLVHVRPAWQGAGAREARAQLQALYQRIAQIPGPLVVWTDEAYGVSTGNWAPGGLFELQVAGGGRGHGHLVATQRPRNVARELFTEADHLFLVPPLSADDLAYVVGEGAPFLSVADAHRHVAGLPPHGYLWIDRRERSVLVGDPLPAWLLEHGRDVIHKRGDQVGPAGPPAQLG